MYLDSHEKYEVERVVAVYCLFLFFNVNEKERKISRWVRAVDILLILGGGFSIGFIVPNTSWPVGLLVIFLIVVLVLAFERTSKKWLQKTKKNLVSPTEIMNEIEDLDVNQDERNLFVSIFFCKSTESIDIAKEIMNSPALSQLTFVQNLDVALQEAFDRVKKS